MRIWLVIAGVTLVVVYLLKPHPLPQTQAPSFDDIVEKTGGSLSRSNELLPEQPLDPRCYLPPLPETATLVLLSAERGQSVSTIAVGSEDVETTVADIIIEEGEAPLYLVVVSTRPVIWRVSGSVDRLRHMVVASRIGDPRDGGEGPPLAAVMGVPRDRVDFFPSGAVV